MGLAPARYAVAVNRILVLFRVVGRQSSREGRVWCNQDFHIDMASDRLFLGIEGTHA